MTLTAEQKARYDWWRKALADTQAGRAVSIPVDDPQCGFYRYRTNPTGPFRPVAIWVSGAGEMVARVGNAANGDPIKMWGFCAKHPITEAAYRKFQETGDWDFPEEVDTKHNLPPENEGFEEEVRGYISEIEKWLKDHPKIDDQKMANRADLLMKDLRGYRDQAENQRKTEKEPHLEAGREVDNKWKALTQPLDGLISQIRTRLTSFLKAAQAKANAKAAQEKTAAPPPKAKAGKDNIKDGKKRSTTLHTVHRCEITDAPKLAAHFANNPKVINLIQSLAVTEYKATHQSPPGCTITEDQEAR